jgi:hypothetical protein
MPDEAPDPHALIIDDLEPWIAHHPIPALCFAGFLLWVSISLILRMWLVHRQASLCKKLRWSIVLLVLLFGWLLYGGFFRVPGYTDMPAPPPCPVP